MRIKHLLFAKKFILPSRAANALQSLTMAYTFAAAGVRTTLFPGFKFENYSLFQQQLEEGYGLAPCSGMNLVPLSGKHKGFYGLNFRSKLFLSFLFSEEGTVFYSRDIKEALMLARFKRRFGLNRPLFFEMHEVLAEQHRLNKTGKEERFRQLELELLAQVNGIIVISSLLEKNLMKFYAPNVPVFTAPMGFNENIFSPVPDVNMAGEVTLAYAGSLYEGKGIHNLVQAMAYLPEKFRLLVMGGKPQEQLEQLQAMAAQVPGGLERIQFTGHLSPTELARRLHSCQMFVIPQNSTAEFFSPIKLYEAMGLGLPMVVTPVPSTTAVLEDGKKAVFAKSVSPQAIAEAIQRLAGDQRLANVLQQNCRAEAEAFTWKQRAENCLDFMQDVLECRE